MTISADIREKILRHYHVDKWRVGTIARQIGIHHSVVKRVLTDTGVEQTSISAPSIIDPFLPFVMEVLTKYPRLTARRVYEMVCERGYSGGPDHFRHLMTLYRPKPIAEAYLRLRTLPGEQAQVDWGHFGYVNIGQAKRPLMAFVMVLSYSRKIFLRFFLNAQMENFLRGHEAAFKHYGGVPRVLLYDNLKSAVLERQGEIVRFNPILLAFASHYHYEPRPVAIARGNEKGRVERAIRYIRDNFFAARVWSDVDDLNAQAMDWSNGVAADRPCPGQNSHSVRAVFVAEKPALLALPDNPYPTIERLEVKVGKTPYVRFDLNDYSIPHTYVRRTLTVAATLEQISILAAGAVIAEHARSYAKGLQIEEPEHIQNLSIAKKKASQHRGQDRLINAISSAATILQQAATRGFNMGQITLRLLQLLDNYGIEEMSIAIEEALSKGTPHPNSIRCILEQRRHHKNKLPLVELDLPADKRVRELIIKPHKLSSYDHIHEE